MIGRLSFAAGETAKTITIFITDDAYVEGLESFNVTLSNLPAGAGFGANPSAVVFIIDNDSAPGPNPVDTSAFFVRHHYLDFLGREPDPPGLIFWTDGIESCGSDAQCRQVKRVNTSAAFFLSIEFQQTGYLVYRFYKASFAEGQLRPRGLPRMKEFLADVRLISEGVVVGQGDWAQRLAQNQQEFGRRWVQTAEFVAQFPADMTASQFVDKLFLNSEAAPTAAERNAAIAAFGAGGVEGRAAALRSVAESGSVFNSQYNKALVLMQYFGYLRRNPDESPDVDFSGYDFWLNKVNSFSLPGEDMRDAGQAFERIKRAEMVRAFIESTEYRGRFGP